MRGHVRKRGSRWVAVIELGRDQTGKRRQRWISGYATKKAAEAGLIDVIGGHHRGEPLDPSKTPLSDYMNDWVKARGDALAPLTTEGYLSKIRNHIEPSPIGAMPLSKIRKGAWTEAPSTGFDSARGSVSAPAPSGVSMKLPKRVSVNSVRATSL